MATTKPLQKCLKELRNTPWGPLINCRHFKSNRRVQWRTVTLMKDTVTIFKSLIQQQDKIIQMHVRRSDFREGWEESEKDRRLDKALISRGHWSIKTWHTQTVCTGFSIYHQACSSKCPNMWLWEKKKSLSIKYLEIDSLCLIYSAWIIGKPGL